jgi:hypothetical protein
MSHVTLRKRVLTYLFLIVLIGSFNPVGVIPGAASQSPAKVNQHEISPDVLNRLGIRHPAGADMAQLSQEVAARIQQSGVPAGPVNPLAPQSGGLPTDLNLRDATSPLVLTSVTGNGRFNEVDLMGDLDGREDLNADHSAKLGDFLNMPEGWALTRNAVSEHTIANGFNANVFYYGDTFGNVYVAADTITQTQIFTTTVLNLPTILNAFGSLNSNDQIVITGLAVNPVADLSSFYKVNGGFSTFNGLVGEILLVSFWDTGGGLRLASNGDLARSGVLAFPIGDVISPNGAPFTVLSKPGFPVMVGTSFGVAFSTFSNLAGVAVDDDGSAYFQQVDLIGFTGANIVKITSVDQPSGVGANQDRSLATSGIITINTLNPLNGNYGAASGPANQVNKFTNYSGTSPTFGNIAALATGPNNVVYAALPRSFVASDSPAVQTTEGLFSNDAQLGATPSMIISFADTSGATDVCSAPPGSFTRILPGPITVTVPFTGSLPVADGFADVVKAGLGDSPGVNNFRVFALGAGPDIRSVSSVIGATPANTLQLDFQVDYTIYSGLTVDEENKVYVVSGGTPAGVGANPSPGLGEVLVFPDSRPYDRRADYVDLRGETVPTPANTFTANVGNGVSDRFDHIYWQAPLDQVSVTPAGIAGLSHGFLLYLNRTRDNPGAFPPGLPNGTTLGDNATSGPLLFELFDAGHQVAGGDDQNWPFTGDDSDGQGLITSTVPLAGGFEFTCTGGGANCTLPMNAFYWNSNGNLTLTSGDTSSAPSASTFLTDSSMKIAPAWSHLNPGSRIGGFHNTFPVQAVGFAGINDFKVRWINVPESGFETCGSQNTFAVSLYDDGTGIDENAAQKFNANNPIGNNVVAFNLQEGPTALIYDLNPKNNVTTAKSPRRDGSGYFLFDYGRMDLLGTPSGPVLVGYSVGGQPSDVAPANLSQQARAVEASDPHDPAILINNPAALFEFFSTGVPPTITVSGGITMPVYAKPVFDLRVEGNDPALSTPINQPDQNRGEVLMVNFQGLKVYIPQVSK